MALYKTGPLAGSISGTVGGVNFAQGRSGNYIRRKMVRADQSSEGQLAARAKLSGAAKMWGELTEPTRKLWRRAAAQSIRLNRVGEQRPRSGYGLFMAVVGGWGKDLPTGGELYADGGTTFNEEIKYHDWTVGGDWEISVTRSKALVDVAHVEVSRGMSSVERQSYKRWVRVYADLILSTYFVISEGDARIPYLGTVAAGEVVGVRARIGSPGSRGQLILSAWTYSQQTIVA